MKYEFLFFPGISAHIHFPLSAKLIFRIVRVLYKCLNNYAMENCLEKLGMPVNRYALGRWRWRLVNSSFANDFSVQTQLTEFLLHPDRIITGRGIGVPRRAHRSGSRHEEQKERSRHDMSTDSGPTLHVRSVMKRICRERANSTPAPRCTWIHKLHIQVSVWGILTVQTPRHSNYGQTGKN